MNKSEKWKMWLILKNFSFLEGKERQVKNWFFLYKVKNIVRKFISYLYIFLNVKNVKNSLTDDYRNCIFMLVKTARQPVLRDYRSDSLSANYNDVHKAARCKSEKLRSRWDAFDR